MNDNVRSIKTELTTQLDCDIIDAVLGQLSDGKWENSKKMEHYWPYISVEKRGKYVFIDVSNEYSSRNFGFNGFLDMSDDKIKFWLATRIKEVIKDEGLDWKRDNDEETDYLSTDWRTSKQTSTVSDCYYVYEVLKGRKVIKHPEYLSKMESLNINKAKKILKENGYLMEATEPVSYFPTLLKQAVDKARNIYKKQNNITKTFSRDNFKENMKIETNFNNKLDNLFKIKLNDIYIMYQNGALSDDISKFILENI